MSKKANPMNASVKSHWSGQFFAAGELVRRGYWTSFTLGNVPSTDLLVISPEGVPFKAEVKTVQEKGNSWWIKNALFADDLFYILVVSRPKDDFPPPEFWVMTSREIRTILKKRERANKGLDQVYLSDLPSKSGGWEKLRS